MRHSGLTTVMRRPSVTIEDPLFEILKTVKREHWWENIGILEYLTYYSSTKIRTESGMTIVSID